MCGISYIRGPLPLYSTHNQFDADIKTEMSVDSNGFYFATVQHWCALIYHTFLDVVYFLQLFSLTLSLSLIGPDIAHYDSVIEVVVASILWSSNMLKFDFSLKHFLTVCVHTIYVYWLYLFNYRHLRACISRPTFYLTLAIHSIVNLLLAFIGC